MAGPRRPGPAPLPNESKRRRGNPGGRALPKPLTLIAPSVVVVDPPGDGADLVRSLIEGPAGAWIGEPDRIALVELLRDAWDERLALRAAIAALPPDWAAGRYSPAAFIRLERVERNLTTWLSMLGLSPADRSRLGVAEVRAKSNLEALRARRDARLGRGRAG